MTARLRSRAAAAWLVALSTLALCGCTLVRAPTAERTDGSFGESISEPGSDDFEFESPAAPDGNPLKVWYVAPDDGGATADILIVMHGNGRDGEDYRDVWAPLVRDRDVLVIVPEFSEDAYPGLAYNMGNMLDEDEDEEAQPRDEWTFQLIEALFEHVVDDVGSDATDYALFGHSAGAQFVHRFLEFGPVERVRIAVAANAGWYTTMDDSVVFPYGLQGSQSTEEDMAPALATDFVLLLGGDDVDPESDALRRDEGSDAQGTNRLERGIHFFATSREMAADRSLDFAWGMTVVPRIAHSHADMAEAAAPILFGAAP